MRMEESPARTHRAWSDEAKARIVEESLAPGAVIAAIARAHKVSASQIYGWRRRALASGAVRRQQGERVQFTSYDTAAASTIEIIIAGATIHVVGNIGEEQLKRVIRAVRSA